MLVNIIMAHSELPKKPERIALSYPSLHFFPGKWMYALVFFVIGVDALWIALARHEILIETFRFVSIAICSAGALLYWWLAQTPRLRQSAGSRKKREIISLFFQGVVFAILFTNAFALFNSLSMTLPFPYADDLLNNWDEALGLDWNAYFRFIAESPFLVSLTFYSYSALGMICFVGGALLLLLQEVEKARFFIIAFTLTVLVYIFVGMFFPARAAIDHILDAPELLDNFHKTPGSYHIPILEQLRSGEMLRFHLNDLEGLVTFPSFHAAAGLILAYSCRQTILFWPTLVYSVLMVLATPVWGGHYFIDIIVGLIVALGFCRVIELLLRSPCNLLTNR